MSYEETFWSRSASGSAGSCPSTGNNVAAFSYNDGSRSRVGNDTSHDREQQRFHASTQTSLYQSHPRSRNIPARTAQATPCPLRVNTTSTALQHARNRPLPPRLFIPNEPPMVPRRPPRRGNCRETLDDIAKRVPLQVMCPYFNYPLSVAAKAMHISSASLKRLCRRHGVKRWPHRQLVGVNRALTNLEGTQQVAGDERVDTSVATQIRELHRRREDIIETAFESGCKKSTAAKQPSSTKGPSAASTTRTYPASTLTPLGNPPLAALLGVV